MAALTASYDALQKEGKVQNYPVGAAKKFYKGSLVCVPTATGFAEAGTDIAASNFVGVGYEDADNSAGAAGALSGRVHKTGSFVFNAVGALQTWVSKPMMLTDDNTVALTSTNSIQVGVCTEFISATKVRVRIDASVK